MAKFALGPHPRMKQILDAEPEVKKLVPLSPTFLDALDKHEKGFSWKDLAPDGVPLITWYSLYDAYLQDEFNTQLDRQEKLKEIENGRTTEESKYRGKRVTGNGGSIDF